MSQYKETNDKYIEGGGQVLKENALLQKQHSIMPSSSGIKVVETTHNKGKVVNDIPELSLQDFPVICSVPTKNGFESLHRGYRGSKSAPPDKEGGLNLTL